MKPENGGDADDFRLNLLAQEITFAKILAGNEFNAAIKEKHIRKLGVWLKHRASSSQAFSDTDCLRLWKGLFFSMWMSDKPLTQESLAQKIASLLHSFDRIESMVQFFAMFLKTMQNEWSSIDQWRIDKFMMFVRRVTREMIRGLQANEWSDEAIALLSKRLSETILSRSHVPRGLFMHFTELFFEEVAKVSNGDISTDRITKLLQPFMFYVASQSDYKLIQFVVRHVFNHLLFQSDAGREYKEKFDAWKSMGFPGKSINELVLEEAGAGESEEDDDEDDDDDDDDDEDEDEEEEGEAEENGNGTADEDVEMADGESALDPRAGRVDVVMPEIQFDAKQICAELEELKYKKFTKVRNRKCLNRIIDTFTKFAGGVFPIGIQKMKIDRSELIPLDIDEKVDEMNEFDDELYGKQRELKGLTKRKRKRIVANQEMFDDFEAKSNKIAKFKHDANVWVEEDISAEVELQKTVAKKASAQAADKKAEKSLKHKVKSATPAKAAKEKPKSAHASKAAEQGTGTPQKLANGAKRAKHSEWEEPLQDGEVEYVIPSKKQQCNGAARITITKDSVTNTVVSPKASKAPSAAATGPTAASPKKSAKQPKPETPAKSPSKSDKKSPKVKTAEAETVPKPSPAKQGSSKAEPMVATPAQKSKKPADEVTTPTKSKKSSKAASPPGAKASSKPAADAATPTSGKKSAKTDATTPLSVSIQLENGLPKSSSKKQKKAAAAAKANNTPLAKAVLLAQADSSTPKLTPSERRVKIALKMNQSQEVNEYITQLKQSPAAPYDSATKPLKGALKPNLAPSPINPFYKRMIGME